MICKHMNIEERACIKKMKSESSSITAIALYRERSQSTISREIKRNKCKDGIYDPVTAHRLYFKCKDNCGRKIAIASVVREYINDKNYDSWSSEQIYYLNQR